MNKLQRRKRFVLVRRWRLAEKAEKNRSLTV